MDELLMKYYRELAKKRLKEWQDITDEEFEARMKLQRKLDDFF